MTDTTTPGRPEPRAWADEMRADAIDDLAAGDWYRAYEDAKSWISIGGGAWILDPWLVYVASALIHGQPKGAVHSIDMALSNWITDPRDRPILHWVRAAITHRRLRDPRTALADYAQAADGAPDWLQGRVAADRAVCEADAERSRKRKASVAPAPAYTGKYAHDVVTPPLPDRPAPGSRPSVWDAVMRVL